MGEGVISAIRVCQQYHFVHRENVLEIFMKTLFMNGKEGKNSFFPFPFPSFSVHFVVALHVFPVFCSMWGKWAAVGNQKHYRGERAGCWSWEPDGEAFVWAPRCLEVLMHPLNESATPRCNWNTVISVQITPRCIGMTSLSWKVLEISCVMMSRAHQWSRNIYIYINSVPSNLYIINSRPRTGEYVRDANLVKDIKYFSDLWKGANSFCRKFMKFHHISRNYLGPI